MRQRERFHTCDDGADLSVTSMVWLPPPSVTVTRNGSTATGAKTVRSIPRGEPPTPNAELIAVAALSSSVMTRAGVCVGFTSRYNAATPAARGHACA